MKSLRTLALLVAVVLAAGEIARYRGRAEFIPLALDELAVAAALLWAWWRSRRDGAAPLLAAFAALCGLALVLLVETAGHMMHGPPKANAWVYAPVLSVLLLLGLWAVGRALRLIRRG